MASNIDKYKKELDELIEEGLSLLYALNIECTNDRTGFIRRLKRDPVYINNQERQNIIDRIIASSPNFKWDYENWYSKSLALIEQLAPNRLDDFIAFYKNPQRDRQNVMYGNYVVSDALIDLEVTQGDLRTVVTNKSAAIPKFLQQFKIVEALKERFESSLYDIKQLMQADLFDSELDAAIELNKKGFIRGAGAIAGVVLENHLAQLCEKHKVSIKKKNPTIADFNDALKGSDVIDMANWRLIQRLTELRNLCDHKKRKDPTAEQVDELIDGVSKVIKTIL